VPDDIMSLLVYNELSHIKSKHNGFILEGFPKTADQLHIYKNWKMTPHLVLVIKADVDTLLEMY